MRYGLIAAACQPFSINPRTIVGSASTACTTTTLPGPLGNTCSKPSALCVSATRSQRGSAALVAEPTAASRGDDDAACNSGATRWAPFGDVTTIQSILARLERRELGHSDRLVDDLDQGDDDRYRIE